MSKLTCTDAACTHLRGPLDSRLGHEDGMHYFNCACGNTYIITDAEYGAWDLAWRQETLRRAYPPQERSAVSRLADIILKRVHLPKILAHLQHGGTFETTEAEAAELLRQIEEQK